MGRGTWSSDEKNPGASVNEWLDIVRRARLGRTTKAVAYAIALRADSDGTNVRPGIARLAFECELSYNVVKIALGKLRSSGLIELEKASTRRGRADEYRLILGSQLGEVDVPTPGVATLAIEAITEAHRRAYTPRPKGDVQPTPMAVQEPESVAEPVDNSVVQPTPMAVVEADPESCTAHGVTCNSGCTAHGVTVYSPRRVPPPLPTHPSLKFTPPKSVDLRADVTAVESPAPEEPRIDPLPARCSHGIRARRRPDGQSTCGACRVGKRLAAQGSAATTPTGSFRIITPRGQTA